MRFAQLGVCRACGLVLGLALAIGVATAVRGQSQEPKPQPLASPEIPTTTSAESTPTSGVSGNTWIGPTWGVTVTWDPAVWHVEDEYLTRGFDGFQLGTQFSSAFIESFDGFEGKPDLCLASAAQEIRDRDREHVIEVAPLDGPPLPTEEDSGNARQLYGVTYLFDDGSTARAIEFLECRTLVPGASVLRLTWQALAPSFNDEFPDVEALFAAVEIPEIKSGEELPPRGAAATPTP